MRLQSSVLLCLLLAVAPGFCGDSHNITHATTAQTSNVTITADTPDDTSIPSEYDIMSYSDNMSSISSKASGTTTQTKKTTDGNNSTTQQTDTEDSTRTESVVVIVLFILCIIIVLIYCTYKWYTRHGRPSFLEACRIVAESARSAWAAVTEHLTPSTKEGEEEEEMEVGINEAEEKKNQEEDAEYDDSDTSSGDYSNMGGVEMMEEPKKDEEQDEGRDDDMTSIELKDEKMEQEKHNLTVL